VRLVIGEKLGDYSHLGSGHTGRITLGDRSGDKVFLIM